jgi:hypothetical protein
MDSKVIVLFLASELLFTAVWTNIASINSNVALAQQQQIPIPKSRSIKITSPTASQQVPINGNVTVTGIVNYGLATPPKSTPTTNNTRTSCFVSVQINGVPPYHRATATGHKGAHDFSTWKYVIDPKLIPLKQGQDNKIAARLSCPQAPNLDSRYVLSFMGVAGTTSPSTATTPNANQSRLKPSATISPSPAVTTTI